MRQWLSNGARRWSARWASGYLTAKEFLLRREEGASLVEYALLVALIALACIVAIEALGGGLSGAFNNMKSALTGKV